MANFSASHMRSQMRSIQRKMESQIRSEQRKAESDFKREINKAARKSESAAGAGVKKLQRDINREVTKTNRNLEQASRPRVTYTETEAAYLVPVREVAEREAASHPDRCDVFLCHAWDDRELAAKELCENLEEFGVSVWFSEKDVRLGVSLTREIDKGLKKSRIGVVLVTPAMLRRLADGGIADKELSVLLSTDRVVPVVHGTDFDALRKESPLLASRSGLSTEGSSLREAAVKIANAVSPEDK